jgi:hypothetical protein
MALEEERAKTFPQKISRLQGLFVFDTEEEAKKAEILWGDLSNHFQPDCLTEASCEIGHTKSKHDSNWITYFKKESPKYPLNWKKLYWEGTPYPNQNPVWETIVDRPLLLWNRELRQSVSNRLHEELRCSFLLRLGILACELGYEVGRSSITLVKHNDCLQIRHIIRFDEPQAIEVVEDIKRTKPGYMSHLKPYDKDTFFIVPDSSSEDFCITHRCTLKSAITRVFDICKDS